jgi:hypothetical protein
MAKTYEISFSASDKVAQIKDIETKVIETKKVSDMEKFILTNLFTVAMNNQKTIAESFECKDCLDQLKNLADTDTKISFTLKDINYLKQAYGLITEKPAFWMLICGDLLKQIETAK